MHETRYKIETMKNEISDLMLVYQKSHIPHYHLVLTRIFTTANFGRNSPVNCDVGFGAKNFENKTAIVTGGKRSSKNLDTHLDTQKMPV